MAYDRNRRVLVLYGGHRHGCCDLNDTWEFDGNTWYQVSTTVSPGLLNGERMTGEMLVLSRFIPLSYGTVYAAHGELILSSEIF